MDESETISPLTAAYRQTQQVCSPRMALSMVRPPSECFWSGVGAGLGAVSATFSHADHAVGYIDFQLSESS